MIGFLLRLSLKFLILSALLYVTFFVPVANRPLFEHIRRIAATKEAKELGSGLEVIIARAKDELTNTVGDIASQRLQNR
jgi:hypothetical protein